MVSCEWRMGDVERTIHHSPLTIHHSPFTIRYSLFAIRYSLFAIRLSASRLPSPAKQVLENAQNGKG
jgi:hypothetical protein